MNSAMPAGAPSRNCWRSAGPASPNSDWYCSFGIPSIQSRSAAPPGRAYACAQPTAVLDLDDVPAGGLELPAPLVDPDAGHHPVQRLPVEVDEPHHVAEAGGRRVGDRLPDVALVQLGVADQRDEPGVRAGPKCASTYRRVTAANSGAAAPRPDRAGGEVDLVRVLGPRRVRLQPAAGPQPRQVRPVQVAQQVLDRVEHRRGVRLDRHPVLGVQVGEPERGHRGDQGGAGRLVPADLHPVAGVPVVVGRVHDPGGEPQHPPLDLVEDVEVVLVHGTPSGRRR